MVKFSLKVRSCHMIRKDVVTLSCPWCSNQSIPSIPTTVAHHVAPHGLQGMEARQVIARVIQLAGQMVRLLGSNDSFGH